MRHQGTLVTGVFAGVLPKISPQRVADQTLDGIEAGAEEVRCDDRTRSVKAALPDDLAVIYPPHQATWDALHPA